MTGSVLFCICLCYFVVAYYVYGGFLKRVFAVDPKRPTPAHTNFDGIDYVPTPRFVLIGHHFASIAGPGPIVGPIMAAYFGWLPALMWILIGCVFIGAFHDFAALVISVRNKGRSISYVMERLMGYTGRQLFLVFCLACLVLIVAIFVLLVANMFVQIPSVTTASLIFIFMAPLFAVVTNIFKVRLRNASFVFVPMVFISVYLGAAFPLDLVTAFALDTKTVQLIWIVVLAIYIFAASVVPVQWLLQPRDYLNSYLLYAMLALGLVSILAYNPEIKLDSFVGMQAIVADGSLTSIVPALFIFVACGACSGFHSLVASGTTSKQINSEKDLLAIGYGSMILEGVLGVMALVAVMSMDMEQFRQIGANQPLAFATGIASFSQALGINVEYAKIFISLAIAAFMLTSLDTATRLARFLWQELFLPRSMKKDESGNLVEIAPKSKTAWQNFITNTIVAAVIIVGLSMLMAMTGQAASIWPIFGASNQLMAALTLLTITLYLLLKNTRWYIAFVPMVFMLVMSIWGIISVISTQWGNSAILVSSGIFLLCMAILMVSVALSVMLHQFKQRINGIASNYVDLADQ